MIHSISYQHFVSSAQYRILAETDELLVCGAAKLAMMIIIEGRNLPEKVSRKRGCAVNKRVCPI